MTKLKPKIIVRKIWDRWTVFDYWDVRTYPSYAEACERVQEILRDVRNNAWPSA